MAANVGHKAYAQLRYDTGGLVVEDDVELYVEDVRPPTPALADGGSDVDIVAGGAAPSPPVRAHGAVAAALALGGGLVAGAGGAGGAGPSHGELGAPRSDRLPASESFGGASSSK